MTFVFPSKETGPTSQTINLHRYPFVPGSNDVDVFETAQIQSLKTHAFSYRATLLEAPPGYGKRFVLYAMYQHMREQGVDAVWLSVDDGNIDAEHFASLLMQACDIPFSAVDSLPEQLIGSLATHHDGRIRAVFIDNLEHCRDPLLTTLLDKMLMRWPQGHTLWMTTERHLSIDHIRYQTEGVLRHLGVSELRFSLEDTRRFLLAGGRRALTEETLDSIYTRTQGWPLSVSLLASIIDKSENDAEVIAQFSGRDIGITDFLRTQFLTRLDADLLDFINKIVLLPQIERVLCSYATRDDASGRFLERLLEENCYLHRLDRSNRRLSFHPLVREFLIETAEKNLAPSVRQEILQRAAQWFFRHKEWALAVECALATRSTDLITLMLHDIAAVWVGQNGCLLPYIDWVEQARMLGAELTLDADYWYLWALCYSRQHRAAARYLELLLQRFQKDSMKMSSENRLSFQRRLEELHILIAFFQEKNELAGQEALKWLDNTAAQDHISTATVACCVAINASINDDFTTARAAMLTAQSGIAHADSEYGAAWVAVLSAQIDFFEGGYLHALQALQLAREHAINTLGSKTIIVSTMQLLMANCWCKMGNYDDASKHLLPGLLQLPSHGISEIAYCGLETALDMWDGSPTGPLSPVSLGRLIKTYPAPMDSVFRCLLARRLLHLGKVDDALYQARRGGIDLENGNRLITMPSVFVEELMAMTRLEYLLHQGMNKHAQLLANESLEKAIHSKKRGRVVELEVLLAVLAFNTGDPHEALRHTFRAIRLAAKQRHLHPFLNRIEIIRLIIGHSGKNEGGFIDQDEIAMFRQLSPTPLSVVCGDDAEAETGRTAGALTTKELELMRLVDHGLSNLQIAERLNRSEITVKWHLSNIYAKLNVRNRTAALAFVRSLKLL